MIYSRLFKYKARADREPLEDFLTEALADLMERMPVEDTIDFLDWAFRESSVKPNWECLRRTQRSWATQVAVPGGIADLVLYAASAPILVIENKTWSGFQDHSTETEKANQVTTYCRWLAGEGKATDACAILLITGTTHAPLGFHTDGGYAIKRRGQVTWASFGRWLRAQVVEEGGSPTLWKTLANDLVVFLKEKKLSSEIFTSLDLSAAHLVLPTMDRWRSTFETIWAGGQEIYKPFLSSRVSDLLFKPEAGKLWHWRYVKGENMPEKAYVALGLRFPDESQWYAALDLPDQPHFIFSIYSDNGRLVSRSPIPEGWQYDEEDGGWLSTLTVDSLPIEPDLRIERLRGWSKRAMTDIHAILSRAKLV